MRIFFSPSGEITVFYVIFFACLAGFFAATMAGFYQTIEEHQPRLQGTSSLLKGNPGKICWLKMCWCMFLHASVYVFACVIVKFSVFAVSAISGVKANFKYDKLFYSEKKNFKLLFAHSKLLLKSVHKLLCPQNYLLKPLLKHLWPQHWSCFSNMVTEAWTTVQEDKIIHMLLTWCNSWL